jgi:hypothetical protein
VEGGKEEGFSKATVKKVQKRKEFILRARDTFVLIESLIPVAHCKISSI